jgi:hypothetical protein
MNYACLTYTDATNTPAETLIPPISILTVDVTLDDVEFAALEIDNDYHVLHDTPNPRPPGGAPGASEWGQLRAYLAHAGMSQAQIRAAIGERDGRSRAQIAAQLTEWLRWQS